MIDVDALTSAEAMLAAARMGPATVEVVAALAASRIVRGSRRGVPKRIREQGHLLVAYRLAQHCPCGDEAQLLSAVLEGRGLFAGPGPLAGDAWRRSWLGAVLAGLEDDPGEPAGGEA